MNIKKMTALSMLTAAALIIFIVEAQLPPLAPIPGIKAGLANIVTLVTMVWYGRKEAFTVLLLRIALGSVFAGQMVSFIYSMAGGLLCFIVVSILLRPLKERIWVMSAAGALAHNAGQIITAVIFTSTPAVAAYFPVLAISAVITGAFTGITAQLLIKRLPPPADK